MFTDNAPGGFLEGASAYNIFTKSRLPTETLSKIWTLVDTQQRGKLDQSEFTVAMHLLRCLLNRSLPDVPASIPKSYFDSVSAPVTSSPPPPPPRGTVDLLNNNIRSTSVSSISSNSRYSQLPQQNPNSPTVSVARQYTGPLQQRIGSNSNLHNIQQEWVITPQERQTSDKIFESLDVNHAGVIGAAEVVPFLTNSKLPEDVLAQIWDLADIHSTGQFGKHEFSIAMYLVQQKQAGRTLPTTLPQSLLNDTPATVSAPPIPPKPHSQPASSQLPVPKSAPKNSSLNDLVSLSDSFASPKQPEPLKLQTQQTTGVGAAFVPTSNFGQTLAKDAAYPEKSVASPQQPSFTSPPTSYSNPAAQAPISVQQPQAATANSFTLAQPDDTDNRISTVKTDVANLQNQVSSMSTQVDQAKEKRQKAEAEMARLGSVKNDLQQKLSFLRAERDKESKTYEELNQLVHKNQLETGKLSQEYQVLEASYHSLQSQVQEVTSQFNQDQQENANIKEKLKVVNEEIANLKAELERIQKEAKNQHNMLNISKQQLNSSIEERDKIQSEIQAELTKPKYEAPQPIQQTSRDLPLYPPTSNQSLSPFPGQSAEAAASAPALPAAASRTGSFNPFYSSTSSSFAPINATTAAATVTPSEVGTVSSTGFDDQYVASSTTSHGPPSSTNMEDTPNTSPNSEFINNPVINAFNLPFPRPQSATSSVQNNPPMSVRGDLDMSRPDTPDSPITSEHVAGMAPPENLEITRITDSDYNNTVPPDTLSTSQIPMPQDTYSEDMNQRQLQSQDQQPSQYEYPTDDRLSSGTESYEMVPHAESSGSLVQPENESQSKTSTTSSMPPTSFPADSGSKVEEPKLPSSSSNDESSKALDNDSISSKDSRDIFRDAKSGYDSSATTDVPNTGSATSYGTPLNSSNNPPSAALPGVPSIPEVETSKEKTENIDDSTSEYSSSDDEGPQILPGQKPMAPPPTERKASESDAQNTLSQPPKLPERNISETSSVPEAFTTAPSSIPPTPSIADSSSFGQQQSTAFPIIQDSGIAATKNVPGGFPTDTSKSSNDVDSVTAEFSSLSTVTDSENKTSSNPAASVAPTASSSSVPPAPPAVPKRPTPAPPSYDPFAAAFEGLEEASEIKDDGFSFAQSAPETSQTQQQSFSQAPFGSEVPEFDFSKFSSGQAAASNSTPFPPATASNVTPFPPATSGFDNSFPSDPAPSKDQSKHIPVSNDEWESLFAGFATPEAVNKPFEPAHEHASKADIDNAFASISSSNAAPGNASAPSSANDPWSVPKEQSSAPQVDDQTSENLKSLLGMGFTTEKSLEALKKNNNNVEAAVNYLLTNQ